MSTIRNIYILCGGRSRRMGRDKYDLEIKGKTFLEHLIDRTVYHFKDVVLLGAGHHLDVGFRQIPDAADDAGPLGGLLAALNDSEDESIAIIPVDLPLITISTFKKLGEEFLTAGDAVAKVAKSEEKIQPLVGVYSTLIAPELEEYLANGKRSVMGFLDQIEVEPFEISSAELMNVNTPEEYQNFLKDIKNR